MEVKAEQFSTVGVEVRRDLGGRGWGRSARGDYGCQGNSNLPQAWTLPTTLHGFLVLSFSNRKNLSNVAAVFLLGRELNLALTRCYR